MGTRTNIEADPKAMAMQKDEEEGVQFEWRDEQNP